MKKEDMRRLQSLINNAAYLDFGDSVQYNNAAYLDCGDSVQYNNVAYLDCGDSVQYNTHIKLKHC